MNALIEQAWRDYERYADGIVQPSIPVLYFGDYERYKQSAVKVVTVGKNPSASEFPSSDRFCRFDKARDVHPAILKGQHYQEYCAALNSYFQNRPYRPWFDHSYEPVLRGAGWSFYNTGRSVALHTDICTPLATSQPWRKVSQPLKGALETHGQELWHRLIEYLRPDVIIASVAEQHRLKIIPSDLTGWEKIYTLQRTNPYTVRATTVRFESGHQAILIYGRDSVLPFQPVSHTEKERIGAAIRARVEG